MEVNVCDEFKRKWFRYWAQDFRSSKALFIVSQIELGLFLINCRKTIIKLSNDE